MNSCQDGVVSSKFEALFCSKGIIVIHKIEKKEIEKHGRDFPGGAVVKNPPANAGDMVQALVRKDPTCRRATKSTIYSY